MIIGITGKSGSGKSTLSKLIGELNSNIKVINIDEIGHEVLTYPSVMSKLVEAFGNEIVDGNGNINRKKVGELVFNNRAKMQVLADITWSCMEQKIGKIIKENNYVILDWILLPQVNFFNMCDIKILVDVPYEIRKRKAMQRDNITESQFDTREKASIEYNKNDFDFIVENDFIIENTEKKASDIYVKSLVSR